MPKTHTPAAVAQDDDDGAVRAAYAEDARAQLTVQARKLRKARASSRREQARLDRLLAEAVSADPTAVLWYARPGVLELADAAQAAELGELAAHKAVERHRAAAATKRARR